MFTQLYQRQDTARAPATNHARAVSRPIFANHARAVSRQSSATTPARWRGPSTPTTPASPADGTGVVGDDVPADGAGGVLALVQLGEHGVLPFVTWRAAPRPALAPVPARVPGAG